MMKRLRYPMLVVVLGLAALALLIGSTPLHAAPVFTEFRATLLQANEVPPLPFTGAYGEAKLSLDAGSGMLRYEVRVSGIAEATMAHIHRGEVGVNGPVVIDLKGSRVLNASTPLTGTVFLNPAQVEALYAGNYYVNVHTAANPAGELRGQLYPAEVVNRFTTQLRGENEVPPVATDEAGFATVWLSDAGTRLDYRVDVSAGITAIGAHIHEGAPGVNGGVIFDLLCPDPAPNPNPCPVAPVPLSAGSPTSGSKTVDATQAAKLLNGLYYINVHTATNPAGLVRGQLRPLVINRAAVLSGASEVPPVTTSATGKASFTMTVDSANQAKLDFMVEVASIQNVTMAHIHRGAPTANGPVVIDLLANGGGTLNNTTPIRGSVMLTPTQLLELLNGNYYVNVHTAVNPGGEIRGQIGVEQRFLSYYAPLSGASEVPAVTTDARGEAAMTLDPSTSVLSYKLVVADIQNITMAHIHAGRPGENGPIVFTLFSGAGSFGNNNPLTGTLQLDAAAIDALNSGNYYVNVHTTANPAGEIRGPLRPISAAGDYVAALSSVNEVPAVTSPANGLARLTLDDSQTKLSYTVTVSNIVNITMAHIHRGGTGVNGPVIYGLFNGTGNFGPASPISGSIDLKPADINELLLETFYVNVHTTANPGGEIRGQIVGQANTAYLPYIAR